jgi:hypothetical protein
MTRQIIALAVGTSSGYLLGYIFGLSKYPFISVLESEAWLSKILLISLLAFLVGAITSLTSWKHTPGLPGMAFSLTLTSLGVSAIFSQTKPLPKSTLEEAWVTTAIESMLILLATLFTYSAAWLADTQVVFRKLAVKPAPKQVNSKLLLTQLLPSITLTILLAAMLRAVFAISLAWSGKITVLCFLISGFLASLFFKSKSTLWYSGAAPFYLASSAIVVLLFPELVKNFAQAALPDKSWNYSLIICGLGSASAILGHWLRMAIKPN